MSDKSTNTAKRNLRVVEDDTVHTPEVLPASQGEADVRPPLAQGVVRTTQISAIGEGETATTNPELLPVTTQVLAFSGAVGVGGLTGFLAARSLKGATVGAGVNVALLGLYGAVMGEGRLSTTSRIVYAALGVGAAVGAGYLVYRDWR